MGSQRSVVVVVVVVVVTHVLRGDEFGPRRAVWVS